MPEKTRRKDTGAFGSAIHSATRKESVRSSASAVSGRDKVQCITACYCFLRPIIPLAPAEDSRAFSLHELQDIAPAGYMRQRLLTWARNGSRKWARNFSTWLARTWIGNCYTLYLHMLPFPLGSHFPGGGFPLNDARCSCGGLEGVSQSGSGSVFVTYAGGSSSSVRSREQ